MDQHVKILGWCFIVFSSLVLLLAVFLFLVIGGAGIASGDREAMMITGAVGTILGVFLIILALPGLITGFGLLKFKPWSRVLGIVLAALNLLAFPFGTALGIYALWVLLNTQTIPLFEPARGTAVTSV